MSKLTSHLFKFLKSLIFHLPLLAEQYRNVVKIDKSMATCDCVETSLTQADTTCLDLFNALLHGALDPMAQSLESVK